MGQAAAMDMLHLKHRIATSPLAGVARWGMSLLSLPKRLRHPELKELLAEERAIQAVLSRLVRKDSHCLDVGAHIGGIAHQLRRLTPKGTLTLIEPLPHKSAMLRKAFPEATVHSVAVSNADGTTTFFENLGQSGYSSLGDRSSRGETRKTEVPLRRIDTLVGDAQVDFIKIDVEGYEHAALQGASNLIMRCRPAILFEAGALEDNDLSAPERSDLFALFDATFGYDIWSVTGYLNGDGPLDQPGYRQCRSYPFKAFNFIALPREGTAG